MSVVCDSACWARVWTAASTAERASSDLGLNSFFSNLAKSLPSSVTPSNEGLAACCSAMDVLRAGGSGLLGGLGRGTHALQQRGVVQHFGDQLFRARLAVHVGDEVGQLTACFQQL